MSGRQIPISTPLPLEIKRAETHLEPGARHVVEYTHASSSQVRPQHAYQEGHVHSVQHARSVAREAREAEGTTQTQHRHERDNELEDSFGNVARQAMLEGHVSPMNIHVPAQLAFHVPVHDQLQADARGVQRMPSTSGLCEQDQQQYPELFEAPQEMQQGSVSQASLNAEREAPQGCQGFFTNSEEQSRMIDEAGESSGARHLVSAPDEGNEEHPCVRDPADFDVQQRLRVLDVQAGRISESSVHPETRRSGHLSPHSSEEVSGTYTGGPHGTVSHLSYYLQPETEQPECAPEPLVSRAAEGTRASPSHIPEHHACQVEIVQPEQRAQPGVHDCLEVERTTHWQRPHQHHNEQEQSHATVASQAICQVPSQSVHHVAESHSQVQVPPQAGLCAESHSFQRLPSAELDEQQSLETPEVARRSHAGPCQSPHNMNLAAPVACAGHPACGSLLPGMVDLTEDRGGQQMLSEVYGHHQQSPCRGDASDLAQRPRPGELQATQRWTGSKPFSHEIQMSGRQIPISPPVPLEIKRAETRVEPGARHATEHTHASSSQVRRQHASQVGHAHPAQHVGPVARDAREAEGTTQWEHRNEHLDDGHLHSNVRGRAEENGHLPSMVSGRPHHQQQPSSDSFAQPETEPQPGMFGSERLSLCSSQEAHVQSESAWQVFLSRLPTLQTEESHFVREMHDDSRRDEVDQPWTELEQVRVSGSLSPSSVHAMPQHPCQRGCGHGQPPPGPQVKPEGTTTAQLESSCAHQDFDKRLRPGICVLVLVFVHASRKAGSRPTLLLSLGGGLPPNGINFMIVVLGYEQEWSMPYTVHFVPTPRASMSGLPTVVGVGRWCFTDTLWCS